VRHASCRYQLHVDVEAVHDARKPKPIAGSQFAANDTPRATGERAAECRGKWTVTDLQRLVLIALQASVFCIVFGFGLKTTPEDLVSLLRRPLLLARSLVAVFVVMPLVAILLSRLFDLRPMVEVALMAIAISPVPPLLPQRHSQTGATGHHALGLVAIFSLTAIVTVPLALEILELIFARPLSMTPVAVARIVLISSLLPLAAGMLVRATWPRLEPAIEKVVTLIARVLLPVAVLALIAFTAPAMWALIGEGTILAIMIFVVAGLAIGHTMGGRDADYSRVLALATAYRHPALAVSIAAANFPGERFGGAIVLYLIVGLIVGLPYIAWQRRLIQRQAEPLPSRGSHAR
jgi:BASS family bile acid:Na+ symporter